MKSVWQESISFSNFPMLDKNIKTEVAVIGGGIAGILTAYMLKNQGMSVVVLEAENICNKVTADTTAKITVQHGFLYQDILKSSGAKKTKLYYDANKEALDVYKDLCKGIDCDFQEQDSYVYEVNDSKKIFAELHALKTAGIKAKYVTDLDLPIKTFGAVCFEEQAQFNPLKFLSHLTGDLTIYEHTKVIKTDGNRVITDKGVVWAEKIVVATHFPFIDTHGSYFLKMYQHRSYVCAIENASQIDGMYVDQSDAGMSFRNYNNYLLIGGGGHRTGKVGGGYKEVENFIGKHYPKAEIKYKWATQDCMTLDKIPYVGKYSAVMKNLYVVTGFNKWGMTSSMAAAMLIRDLICGIENRYKDLFSPSRSILKPQLAINAFEAISGWVYPSAKRCPHLGCTLKWNKQEHTWDCPCHGSRFTRDGGLLDNPATRNLNK